MTIEEVASKMGITKGTLSAALSGNPTVSYLTRVADAIDCDIRDLFRQKKGVYYGSLFSCSLSATTSRSSIGNHHYKSYLIPSSIKY